MLGSFHVARAGRSGKLSNYYDPAVLSLTAWWRASYTASPWVGTASAGSSGSKDATEATNPPSTGSLNGRTTADFDATNDILTNATAFSSLGAAAAYFYWVLFYADAITGSAAIATPYDNEALVTVNNGYWGASLSTNGSNHAQAWHWNGAVSGNPHPVATGAWNLLCARYDGSTVRSKLNSVAIVGSAAAANITNVAGTFRMGQNHDGSVKFNGQIADFGIMQTAGTDALFDDIKAYCNGYHGLAL